MTARRLASKDIWIGCLYLAAGGGGWLIARDYAFGSAGRMGPGYFPTVICMLLLGFGAVSVLRGWRDPGEPVAALNLKGLLLVAGSVAAFAALLPRAGFVAATIVMVLTSAVASARFKLGWRPLLGLAALTAACAAVFIHGLGIPMPLTGSWFHAAAPVAG